MKIELFIKIIKLTKWASIVFPLSGKPFQQMVASVTICPCLLQFARDLPNEFSDPAGKVTLPACGA